jgi:hypothetical protein
MRYISFALLFFICCSSYAQPAFDNDNIVLYQSLSDHYHVNGINYKEKTRIAITLHWVQIHGREDLGLGVTGIQKVPSGGFRVVCAAHNINAIILATPSSVIVYVTAKGYDSMLVEYFNKAPHAEPMSWINTDYEER